MKYHSLTEFLTISFVIRLQFGATESSLRKVDLDCAEPYAVFKLEGNISSDYIVSTESYLECDWLFTGFHGSRIKFEFSQFDLPDAMGKGYCKEAFVMYGGYTHDGKKVVHEKICGAILPETFVSSGGNAWLSYTFTGLSKLKSSGNLSSPQSQIKGFTVKFTITKSELFENQLIVGLTCGLALPTCCCVPLCLYVRKLKKKKLKEIAETDKVKKLQKLEDLKRTLEPIKRNRWNRLSLRRKVVLKSAGNLPLKQPTKRRRLSGSTSFCELREAHPPDRPPPGIGANIYEDIAQYIDPGGVNPLSYGKKVDGKKKKWVRPKNTQNLIRRIRSSTDNHTYISLTDIPSNVACQGSASSCPWNERSEGLHSSTPMPVKPVAAQIKHSMPATTAVPHPFYITESQGHKKPSPVAGATGGQFISSDTMTSSSGEKNELSGIEPPGSKPDSTSASTDVKVPSDENNNFPWLPHVIVTKHGEESSSQSCSFLSVPAKETGKQNIPNSAPDSSTQSAPDTSTQSGSYHIDSAKERNIRHCKPISTAQKLKSRTRVNGTQSKLRAQNIKKRPRPIKEEESTESYISTDPTDQSDSDHSVQNVDWSFEDPRHLSLIKECLEETDRATSFETMMRSLDNIRDHSRLHLNNMTDNAKIPMKQGKTEEKQEENVARFNKKGAVHSPVDYIGDKVGHQQGEDSKAAVVETLGIGERNSSSSWELTPGVFTKKGNFDFIGKKTRLRGIKPLEEKKQQQSSDWDKKQALFTEITNGNMQPTNQLEYETVDLKERIQSIASDSSGSGGYLSESSYRKAFMPNISPGNCNGKQPTKSQTSLSDGVNPNFTLLLDPNSTTHDRLTTFNCSFSKVPSFRSTPDSVFFDTFTPKGATNLTFTLPYGDEHSNANTLHIDNSSLASRQKNTSSQFYQPKETPL